MAQSFFWHDYETFGRDPARDRAAQFAGIRTDLELNEIGQPLMIYCRPTPDYLPEPEACLITGITPQKALAEGLCEADFVARIHQEMMQPNTCTVGFNSIRFDDEFTRHLLYRNFYDAYEREYKNGNSRWDIIDALRMAYALRPEGIVWPQREDSALPSFKLEHLTAANGITHGDAAHDALADVRATIAIARLLKTKQPRLYDWLFNLRNKHEAAGQLDLLQKPMVVHSSRMFPAEWGCTTLIMPLAMSMTNKNQVICYDLRYDPTPLLDLDAEQIRALLFTAQADLPEGTERIHLKNVLLNKAPALAPLKTLSSNPAAIERIGIDLAQCEKHREMLLNASGLTLKVQQVFERDFEDSERDPEAALYGGGFFSHKDRRAQDDVRSCPPSRLGEKSFRFEDARLPELLFRYRARNFPETLNAEEQQRWLAFCRARVDIKAYQEDLQQRLLGTVDEAQIAVFNDLLVHSEQILIEIGLKSE